MLNDLLVCCVMSLALLSVAPAIACGGHASHRSMAYEARLAQWEQAEMTETLLNQADGSPAPAEAKAETQLLADNPVSWLSRTTRKLLGQPAVPAPYTGGKIRSKKGAKSVPATNPQLKRAKQQQSGGGF